MKKNRRLFGIALLFLLASSSVVYASSEYYSREAARHLRDAEYQMKEADRDYRAAESCLKKGDASGARMRREWGDRAMSRARMYQGFARDSERRADLERRQELKRLEDSRKDIRNSRRRGYWY